MVRGGGLEETRGTLDLGKHSPAPLRLGRGVNPESVTTSKSRIAKPGCSGAKLWGSNPSQLCVNLGKPLHLSQLIHNILIADKNVYLIKLRQLTANPHNQ